MQARLLHSLIYQSLDGSYPRRGMTLGEAANSAQGLTTENWQLRTIFQKSGQTGPSVLKGNLCSISHHLLYLAFFLLLFDLFWICLTFRLYWCSWLQMLPSLFKFKFLLLFFILLFALQWFLRGKVTRALWGVSYCISKRVVQNCTIAKYYLRIP